MSHQLETIIGYKFKHPELLETALTHTSYANESRAPVKHNERLEFLGDSVLQIVSADYLFHAYADRPEGDLTRIRASLVSEGALFQFAQEIHLGEYLRLGRGEERCGGRTRPSVVSDAFEAVIAALYLDKSERLCATMKVYPYLQKESPYQKDDVVTGMVYEISHNFGAFVAVDDKYSALIPKKELYGELHVLQQISARVTGVKEDGKLDLGIRQKAHLQMNEDADKVLSLLQEKKGFLPLHDKSSPEQIRETIGMSKNEFKRAIGHLYKEHLIMLESDGIRLKK